MNLPCWIVLCERKNAGRSRICKNSFSGSGPDLRGILANSATFRIFSPSFREVDFPVLFSVLSFTFSNFL